ncbi:MAG: T9SS type A sorting domain-containing protein, partial [Candidatus Marinimicrobia bacterium]|nr:T9SS type A sorting domain-containing protein [Candidatus Neomarinimicrobiota bacterium]
ASGAVVSGTPTEGITSGSFRVIASDGSLFDTLDVTITVAAVDDPPVITSSATATGTEDVAFSYTVTATDAEGATITFAFSSLSSWLSASGAVVSGTPTEGITSGSFRVIASDGSLFDTLDVTITVEAVNDPPLLSNLPDVVFNEDEKTVVHFSDWFALVDDPDNADSTLIWSLESGVGDSVSFVIQGDSVIFEAPQDWFAFDRDTLKVRVSDGSLSDSTRLALHVMPVNDAPMFVDFPDSVILEFGESDTLILSNYALDIDDPDSVLTFPQFACVGADSIVCVTTNADTAFIDPVGNFSGTVDFEFIVTDTSGAADTVSIVIYVMKPVGIDNEGLIPLEYSLANNYPNPFNPQTTISYGLPRQSDLTLIIYNIMGQEIMRWDEQNIPPGFYRKTWNGRNKFGVPVVSGVYFYRIQAGDFVKTKKMVLLK